MISVEGVNFSYEPNTQIINNLSFDIEPRDFYAVVGNSGTGKSTLLNIISGLLRPNDGQVLGRPILAYQTQQVTLLPYLNVIENAMLSIELREGTPQGARKQEAEKMLIHFGIGSESFDKLPGELSGGMQQRVALVQTMLTGAQVYVLDEPFNAIDRNNLKIIQHYIWQSMTTVNASVIMVTHDLEQIVSMANKVISLNKNHEGFYPEVLVFEPAFVALPPSERMLSPMYNQHMFETIQLLSLSQ